MKELQTEEDSQAYTGQRARVKTLTRQKKRTRNEKIVQQTKHFYNREVKKREKKTRSATCRNDNHVNLIGEKERTNKKMERIF